MLDIKTVTYTTTALHTKQREFRREPHILDWNMYSNNGNNNKITNNNNLYTNNTHDFVLIHLLPPQVRYGGTLGEKTGKSNVKP